MTIDEEVSRPTVLLLLIYSKSKEYSIMRDLQERYINSHPDIDTYYCMYDEEQEESIKIVDGNIIKVRGQESYLNILEKTITAIDFCCNRNLNSHGGRHCYDYVIRSNISTIWNLEKLYKYITNCPCENLYTGGIMLCLKWLDRRGGIRDNRYFNTQFIQGTGIIMSQDVVRSLITNRTKLKSDIVDDVAIGIFMDENKIPIIDTGNKLIKEEIMFRNHSMSRIVDIKRMIIQIRNIGH